MRPFFVLIGMNFSLYEHPDIYMAAMLNASAEEIAFYEALLPGGGRVVSLGCGPARIESRLKGRNRFVGVDLSPAMVREARKRDSAGHYVVGRIEAPPLRGRFDGAMSTLLSTAYVTERAALVGLFRWVGSVLDSGAPLVLELPVAHRPSSLQGIAEQYELADGQFLFQYLDVDRHEEEFWVLHSLIEVRCGEDIYERRAPLAVFTPEGIRGLLESDGLFRDVAFYPPYDLAAKAVVPPEDCLRAVVVAKRV